MCRSYVRSSRSRACTSVVWANFAESQGLSAEEVIRQCQTLLPPLVGKSALSSLVQPLEQPQLLQADLFEALCLDSGAADLLVNIPADHISGEVYAQHAVDPALSTPWPARWYWPVQASATPSLTPGAECWRKTRVSPELFADLQAFALAAPFPDAWHAEAGSGADTGPMRNLKLSEELGHRVAVEAGDALTEWAADGLRSLGWSGSGPSLTVTRCGSRTFFPGDARVGSPCFRTTFAHAFTCG
eukprot:gnl/TRDRNA2_/TRDRNA2_166889_c0_seq1.p1 gnl/TRDRNA2_/TRDRNA2_166889_c0~~gnl/TRDRNA2_/TRDRNA2_166889_c0_seq1.p1  ORF type:complete len:244 (-),score=23.84 gnl/TRDRNA2_/TRDRNA2_166889_c0_seq1:314-1045(-)